MEKIIIILIIILIIIVIIIYLINMNSKSNELELFEDTNSLLDQNTNDLISLYQEFNERIILLGRLCSTELIYKIDLKQGDKGKIEPLIGWYLDNIYFSKYVDPNPNPYYDRYWQCKSFVIIDLRELDTKEKNLINKRNQYLQN